MTPAERSAARRTTQRDPVTRQKQREFTRLLEDMQCARCDGPQHGGACPTTTDASTPRTEAGRALLDDLRRRGNVTMGGLDTKVLAIEAEAATAERERAERLEAERLKRCPSLMAILNRLGRFNDAWWDRLANEYAAASSEPQQGCAICGSTTNEHDAAPHDAALTGEPK